MVRLEENDCWTSPYLNGSDGFEEREILIFNELTDIKSLSTVSVNDTDWKHTSRGGSFHVFANELEHTKPCRMKAFRKSEHPKSPEHLP